MMAWAGVVAPAGAQEGLSDVVTTAYVTDTIAGYGAVGGVAVDALGFVYVADFQNAVWRYGADGSLVKLSICPMSPIVWRALRRSMRPVNN